MDGQVARRQDKELADLLDKFVCVRVVQGWGLDLSLFQFDNDLTWAAFFLNADKTMYGRYGTKSSKDAMKDLSMEGFTKTVKGALELHRGYPANKASLAGKTGPAPRWKTPETIPAMVGKHKKGDVSRWGCVHCHMAHEGEIQSLWTARETVEDRLLWKYLMPDWLGLKLDIKEMATVSAVDAGSAAAKAGFKTGDKILRLEGQAMISIADVQWVLHTSKEPGEIKAEVERAAKKVEVKLSLAAGWRRAGSFVWPGHITAWMMQLSIPGFGAQALEAAERTKLGLAEGTLALKVQHVNNANDKSTAGAKAGVQKGDVIIAADGKNTLANESEFLAYLVQKKRPGETVELTLLRGGKQQKVTLTLP